MTRASEWSTRVAAWRASGKTAKEFCKGKDYTANRLLWWSSALNRRKVAPKPNPLALMRVVGRSDPVRLGVMVVHLGDARVEVPAGADRATLCTVLDVLRPPREGRGAR